ncbi:MAG TPA: helix-turn-helix domain-containing protein [Bryobacteraceae bacterium]|jgi:putative transposase|nr:helix-turn-helix domain-containing protein [Bryobacteraceae bacterium]HXJ40826.1 helix-turn-helix domain-containing protein [Bryobacteraceae bacterium]
MPENSVKYIQETGLSTSTAAQSSPSTVVAGTLSRNDMEQRRMEAAEDFLHGLSHSHVVAKFGVSRTTASRWHRALTARGLESLRKGKATGRPCRLTPEQKSQVTDVFEQGAAALGYPNDRWTPTLLARMIEERFSVRYSLDHVTRLMAKLVGARNQAAYTAVKAAARGTRPHAT